MICEECQKRKAIRNARQARYRAKHRKEYNAYMAEYMKNRKKELSTP